MDCTMQQLHCCSIIQRLLCPFSTDGMWNAKWFCHLRQRVLTNVVDKVLMLNGSLLPRRLKRTLLSFLCCHPCDNLQSLTSIQWANPCLCFVFNMTAVIKTPNQMESRVFTFVYLLKYTVIKLLIKHQVRVYEWKTRLNNYIIRH